MAPFFVIARGLRIALSLSAVWFAVEKWFWFQTLPKHSSARFCGNCFLAAVGIPIELGLLGLLVIAASLLGIPFRGENSIYWCTAAVGVFLTPSIIGVPLFAIAFLVLMLPAISALFMLPVSRRAN